MPEPIPAKVWGFTDTLHSDTYPAIDVLGPNSPSFSGKAVFITGAGKGLGRAFSIAYAQAGASYIILGTRTDASDVKAAVLKAAAGAGRDAPAVIAVTVDVCDQSSVDAAAARIRAEVGRLDILINNAGYMAPEGTLLELKSSEYLRTLDVNLIGTYRVTKAVLPLMLERGDKTVVAVTSVASHAVECAASYSIAKFAVCRFSQFVAEEYGHLGVVSYAYHPGGVVTNLSSNLPDHIKARLVDTPELSSHTLVYLTRTRPSWLTGRYISANWDMPELIAVKSQVVEGNLLKFEMRSQVTTKSWPWKMISIGLAAALVGVLVFANGRGVVSWALSEDV